MSHQSARKGVGLGYTKGYVFAAGYPAWNSAGLIAFLLPVALTILAIVSARLEWEQIANYTGWFYTYGWFTGSILGGLIYYIVAKGEARSSP